jgi:hypothetical protein
MAKQCPNCRTITQGQATSCEGCGFAFNAASKGKRGFAETCLKIGVAITLAAGLTAVIAKLI